MEALWIKLLCDFDLVDVTGTSGVDSMTPCLELMRITPDFPLETGSDLFLSETNVSSLFDLCFVLLLYLFVKIWGNLFP